MTIAQILLHVSEWLGVGSLTWIAGLSPRFHRRPINFIYQRRENIISFSLYTLALLLGFFVRIEFQQANSFTLYSLSNEIFLRLLLAIVLLAPFVIALIYRRQPVRTLGWGKATLRPALQLGLGLIILVIFLHGKIFSIINQFSAIPWAVFLALLAIALVEESVFRGYIFIRLTAGFGSISGLAITALLSTIWQAAFFVNFGASLDVVLLSLVFILAQSLLLGWIMQKSGHVAAPAMYAAISNMMVFIP